MIKVLLVEDDDDVAQIICYHLQQLETYEVVRAKDAGEALGKARDAYDIILLDIMLPDISGIKLCAQLRKWHQCPIIFTTAVDDSDTLIQALDMGGDDYICKPFDPRVLDARIRANLRRVHIDQQDAPANQLSCKRFSLDANTHELKIGRTVTELMPMEFKILLYLMQHPKQHFTPSELYQNIWGRPSYGDTRTVTVHIYNLRKKIEADPKDPVYIKSAWGKGYYFDPQGK